jgi:hypothetical protein
MQRAVPEPKIAVPYLEIAVCLGNDCKAPARLLLQCGKSQGARGAAYQAAYRNHATAAPEFREELTILFGACDALDNALQNRAGFN